VQAPAAPVTSLAISSGTDQTAIAPGKTGDIDVAVQSSSTGEGSAILGADAPAGWTVTASPQTIQLSAAPTSTLATLHVTPPADALGDYRAGLDRLASVPGIRSLVPGHGHLGDAAAMRARVAMDVTYLDAVQAGREPGDPRLLGPSAAWLRAEHARQLAITRPAPGRRPG